jgi:hypothetical protein
LGGRAVPSAPEEYWASLTAIPLLPVERTVVVVDEDSVTSICPPSTLAETGIGAVVLTADVEYWLVCWQPVMATPPSATTAVTRSDVFFLVIVGLVVFYLLYLKIS